MKCSHPQCTNLCAVGYGQWCRKHSITHGYSKRLVPASEAQILIRGHLTQGATLQSIAKATGMGQTNLRQILDGERQSVREASITALKTARPATRALVPAYGSARRLQSLRAAGKHIQDLITALGIGEATITALCNEDYERINARIDQRIRHYYREHITDQPTDTGWYVKKQGWKLPGQWRDIDNPRETHAR